MKIKITEMIKNFREKMKEKKEAEAEIDDDETRDKFLRSLRRERRTQMEEIEKIRLKKQIAQFKRDRTRKYMFGMKQKDIKRPIQRRGCLLSSNVGLLRRR
jgi:hypothetical protein